MLKIFRKPWHRFYSTTNIRGALSRLLVHNGSSWTTWWRGSTWTWNISWRTSESWTSMTGSCMLPNEIRRMPNDLLPDSRRSGAIDWPRMCHISPTRVSRWSRIPTSWLAVTRWMSWISISASWRIGYSGWWSRSVAWGTGGTRLAGSLLHPVPLWRCSGGANGSWQLFFEDVCLPGWLCTLGTFLHLKYST